MVNVSKLFYGSYAGGVMIMGEFEFLGGCISHLILGIGWIFFHFRHFLLRRSSGWY